MGSKAFARAMRPTFICCINASPKITGLVKVSEQPVVPRLRLTGMIQTFGPTSATRTPWDDSFVSPFLCGDTQLLE